MRAKIPEIETSGHIAGGRVPLLLHALNTFCRVVDERSFTRAAATLNLSQPTVTKQVQRLEAEFGLPLLERGQRELELTPAGEIVYTHARKILNTLEECRESVAILRTPGRGELSIGAVSTITLFTLPRLLEQYAETHPFVTLHVKSGNNEDILDLILHNEVDVGLTTVPITHDHIITRPLFLDKVVLIASSQTAKEWNGVISQNDLAALPMIAHERRSQFRLFVDAAFQSIGATTNVVMEFDTHEAVKTMVRLGLGVAMVPESTVKLDLEQGQLAVLKIEGVPEIGRITSMITRRDRERSEALSDFISLVESEYPNVPSGNLS